MDEKQSNSTLFEDSPFTLEKLSGRGGSFLIIPVDRGEVFCREKFSEDQKMFEQAAFEFAQNKIKPQYKDLNKMNKDLSLELFKEVGQLGFLGIDLDKKKPEPIKTIMYVNIEDVLKSLNKLEQ